jgi:hypothetical protein
MWRALFKGAAIIFRRRDKLAPIKGVMSTKQITVCDNCGQELRDDRLTDRTKVCFNSSVTLDVCTICVESDVTLKQLLAKAETLVTR